MTVDCNGTGCRPVEVARGPGNATQTGATTSGVHSGTPSVSANMLPPGLDDPAVWRLRFIVTSTLAPGKTMQDHQDNLKDHHAYLEDLQARVRGRGGVYMAA